MDEIKNERVAGTVDWFNGIIGRAIGSNNKIYKLHINNFRSGQRKTAKSLLRKGSKVEFSVRPLYGDAEAAGYAMDVVITSCPPLPDPTGFAIGYWEDVHGFRCSSCGEKHRSESAWCPDCGARMYSKDLYDIMLPRLVHSDLNKDVDIDRNDYSRGQWSELCKIFGADPETVTGLNISHPIVMICNDR